MGIKRRKPPMAITGTPPLTVNNIMGEWRIALGHNEEDLFGNTHYIVRWYLPQTSRQRTIVKNHVEGLGNGNHSQATTQGAEARHDSAAQR